eukprot:1137110-Pelagomonas_calceolata.AAC.1
MVILGQQCREGKMLSQAFQPGMDVLAASSETHCGCVPDVRRSYDLLACHTEMTGCKCLWKALSRGACQLACPEKKVDTHTNELFSTPTLCTPAPMVPSVQVCGSFGESAKRPAKPPAADMLLAPLHARFLQSALEGKQPRSDKHRKRRHVHQEEELAGTDGADNGVGITGEANGGGGRWGHDMYEKEYGEPMPIKGNKKRNLMECHVQGRILCQVGNVERARIGVDLSSILLPGKSLSSAGLWPVQPFSLPSSLYIEP